MFIVHSIFLDTGVGKQGKEVMDQLAFNVSTSHLADDFMNISNAIQKLDLVVEGICRSAKRYRIIEDPERPATTTTTSTTTKIAETTIEPKKPFPLIIILVVSAGVGLVFVALLVAAVIVSRRKRYNKGQAASSRVRNTVFEVDMYLESDNEATVKAKNPKYVIPWKKRNKEIVVSQ